jgi:hypothetical protein
MHQCRFLGRHEEKVQVEDLGAFSPKFVGSKAERHAEEKLC